MINTDPFRDNRIQLFNQTGRPHHPGNHDTYARQENTPSVPSTSGVRSAVNTDVSRMMPPPEPAPSAAPSAASRPAPSGDWEVASFNSKPQSSVGPSASAVGDSSYAGYPAMQDGSGRSYTRGGSGRSYAPSSSDYRQPTSGSGVYSGSDLNSSTTLTKASTQFTTGSGTTGSTGTTLTYDSGRSYSHGGSKFDTSEYSNPGLINVRTASGALYALAVTPADTVQTLLEELRRVDVEAGMLPDLSSFELYNELNQKLMGAQDHKLRSFGVRAGDELHVRYVPFPPYYVMMPKYQQLVMEGDTVAMIILDMFLSTMGCLLIVFASRCQIEVGQWWSDALELEYRVPLTFESLAVSINGALLGPYLGLGSMLLYTLCVAVDFKVLPGGLGGYELLYESPGGYIWGMLIASFVAGKLSSKGWDRGYLSAYLMIVAVIVIIDLLGIVWLPFGMSQQFDMAVDQVSCGFGDGCVGNLLMWGSVPFLFGHIIKSIMGAILIPMGWRITAYSCARRHRALTSVEMGEGDLENESTIEMGTVGKKL